MKAICRKIFDIIKRNDEIFMLVLICVSTVGITMNIKITAGDELWNFQSIYKMTLGYKIYNDFNVIITPLFFYIGEGLFKIFGANFLTFRIYNTIIMTSLYFVMYKLLKEVDMPKKFSIITIMLIMLYKYYEIIRCQASYNQAVVIFYILGVTLCLKQYKYNTILQGIILFMVFATKQNILVYYSIGLIAYEMSQENKFKNKITNLIKEFLIALVLFFIFIIFLYQQNNLIGFIDYTVRGIGEFNKENIVIYISSLIVSVFFIFTNTISLNIFNKIHIQPKTIKKLKDVNYFAIPLTLMCYPIMNSTHTTTANYLNVLVFMNVIYILFKEIGVIKKKFTNLILCILVTIGIINSCFHIAFWGYNMHKMIEEQIVTKESPFFGGNMTKEDSEKIKKITQYIKNNSNDVIILSSQAAFYMIPLQRNNGMLDLPFKGNFGSGGEEAVIQFIERNKNIEIFINVNVETRCYQESDKVINYIEENMKNIGQIEEFKIFVH